MILYVIYIPKSCNNLKNKQLNKNIASTKAIHQFSKRHRYLIQLKYFAGNYINKVHLILEFLTDFSRKTMISNMLLTDL